MSVQQLAETMSSGALVQLLEREHGGRLGFSDCLVLEVARKAGHIPLGSFDRNLARLDGIERI